MPYVLRIANQNIVLEDADAERVLTQLVRAVRTEIWERAGGVNSYFETYYRIWRNHDDYHRVNLFLWTVEALGNATLPQRSWVYNLRRQNRRLNASLNPRGINTFFENFAGYNQMQNLFVRDMRVYMERVQGGTGTAIVIAEQTRNVSFMTLQVCATVLTAGASTPAQVTAATAANALMRSAAVNFLFSQIDRSATNLRRALSGERVTVTQAFSEVLGDALGALGNAALGEVIARFRGPLTDNLSQLARREMDRGNLVGGMSFELTVAQLDAAIAEAVQWVVREQPNVVRAPLAQCTGAGGDNATARVVANSLMRDRAFRRTLEERIQANARR